MTMRRILLLVSLVGILAVLDGCRFSRPECDQQLVGSQVLADIDARSIPIVCEDRPASAPSWAAGWFDGTGIHIWGDPPLWVAEHEFGHWWHTNHPDELAWWTAARDLSGQTATGEPKAEEDFADSWAWCVYGWQSGIFYAGVPTDDQCAAMNGWYQAG